MDTSCYNIYIDAANNQSFIYNTMTTSLLLVDNTVRQYLQENNLVNISPSVMKSLEKCGIVTDNDELSVYRFNCNTATYNTDVSSFLLFTTYACNLACPYCYEGPPTAEYRSTFMKPETTSKVVTFICEQVIKNRSQAVGIALYGGEPLLNMDCCLTVLHDVYHWCKTKNIPFSATIMSNGTLLTKDVYRRIGTYIDYIHITLDGPKKFHDKTRSRKDGSGTYTQILQNLKQLKTTKEYLQVRINIDEESMYAVGDVLNDLEKIGLKGRPRFYIYFSQIIPQNICFTVSSKEYEKDTIAGYLPVITEMAETQGWGPHLRVEPDQKLASAEALSCGYVKCGTYTINPEGDIYVCPALTNNPLYKTGTIKNYSVEWYPLYYHILTRDPTSTIPCSTCEFLPLCKGGCPVSPVPGDKNLCSSRTLLYEKLRKYLEYKFPEEF